MNLLIFSRPGIRIYQELKRSETAWNALRFYDPIEIPVGILVQLSSLSAALSLASDLKYFIRKFGSEHLFEISPGVYCTPSVARTRYVERSSPAHPWPWKIWYWVQGDGNLFKYTACPEMDTPPGSLIPAGYIYEVQCSEDEYSVSHLLLSGKGTQKGDLQKEEADV
ncbi:MAG TPA: hypothetical protein PK024_07890 [Methanospirillum sp.]|uniref:hypothetical protein n=1 Tax=Methanospirillum sp. TaxID=45200 RepID=UPI002C224415|nr:hypothetical protein [Methanospirillum sp.]HOJ96737.1 hypothetical protein [Methanospirillum sp.]HOL41839.1 hypothetical protein [Methanospirillum sp.]HPP78429.1 hypothetical protein [Methanospirillum sp.]